MSADAKGIKNTLNLVVEDDKWIEYEVTNYGWRHSQVGRPFRIAQSFIEFNRFYYYSKELFDSYVQLSEGRLE